jgi:thiamine kinase-like enzyme
LTEEKIARFPNQAQGKSADFVAFMGGKLSQKQIDILHTAVSAWPARRQKRLIKGTGITLVHRDPHPLNLLYSHDLENASVKLIDWQSWRVDTGTDDVAYYIACHWPQAVRVEVELSLVQRYHQQLLERGVTNYGWDDCWYDYRASVLRCIFFLIAAWSPVQWERGWWWPKLAQGIQACDDLDCLEILAA